MLHKCVCIFEMKDLSFRKLDGEECPSRTPRANSASSASGFLPGREGPGTLLCTKSFPLCSKSWSLCQDLRAASLARHVDVPKLTAGILLMDGIQTISDLLLFVTNSAREYSCAHSTNVCPLVCNTVQMFARWCANGTVRYKTKNKQTLKYENKQLPEGRWVGNG